jgi:hypothetical protein
VSDRVVIDLGPRPPSHRGLIGGPGPQARRGGA